MNSKKSTSPVIIVVFVIVVLFLLGMAFPILIKQNEMKSQLDELTNELDKLQDENEKLEYELGLALDEENIRRIAKDKLGLVDPNDEYYFSD